MLSLDLALSLSLSTSLCLSVLVGNHAEVKRRFERLTQHVKEANATSTRSCADVTTTPCSPLQSTLSSTTVHMMLPTSSSALLLLVEPLDSTPVTLALVLLVLLVVVGSARVESTTAAALLVAGTSALQSPLSHSVLCSALSHTRTREPGAGLTPGGKTTSNGATPSVSVGPRISNKDDSNRFRCGEDTHT